MKKNWPYFIVASFLNTTLVTGTFIAIKLRGIAVHSLYELNPLQFAGGMFVLSFVGILLLVGIKVMVTGIGSKMHLFERKMPQVNGLIS